MTDRKARLQVESIDVSQLARQVVDGLQCRCARRRISIRLFGHRRSHHTMADPEQLAGVLQTLVSTAFRFSAGGGEIEIALRRVQTSLLVWVRDQGPGIPQDELATIQQCLSESPARPPGEDTVQGELARCRDIMAAHGGRLLAWNEPQGGAFFCLELPLHLPAACDPAPTTSVCQSSAPLAAT